MEGSGGEESGNGNGSVGVVGREMCRWRRRGGRESRSDDESPARLRGRALGGTGTVGLKVVPAWLDVGVG